MKPDTLVVPGRFGQGSMALALALQCLPLLAVASGLVRGLYGEEVQQAWFLELRWLVILSALSWGLGYLPLRRWGRAAVALTTGVVGNLLAANAALGAWSGAPDGAGEAALRRAALVWAGLAAMAVLILLVDTWHLGGRAFSAVRWPQWSLVLIGFLVIYLIFERSAATLHSTLGQAGLLVAILVVGTTLVAERRVSGGTARVALRALGLGWPAGRALRAGVLLSLLLLAFYPALVLLADAPLSLRPGWPWLTLGLFAQGGVAEELLFRGYLFRHLREGRSFWRAAWLAMLPFVAVHLPLFVTLGAPLAIASIALAMVISFPLSHLFEQGGKTIWAPALLHFVIQGSIKLVILPESIALSAPLAWMALSATVPYLAFALRGPAVGAGADAGRSGAVSSLGRGVVVLVALLGSGLALGGLLPLGVIVAEGMVYPLALAVAVLLAALGAGWAGTWIAADGTRTRLAAVIGTTEVTAAGLALLLCGYFVLRGWPLPHVFFITPLVIGGVCALVLALSAGVATWRFRYVPRVRAAKSG